METDHAKMKKVSDFPPGYFKGWDPKDVVRELGWKSVKDPSEIDEHCGAVVREFVQQAEEYREGKKALIGFFISKVMERTEGGADPAMTRKALERLLSA